MHVHLRPIHHLVQQKLTRHSKAVIPQFKNKSVRCSHDRNMKETRPGLKAKMLREDFPGLGGREAACQCRRHGLDPRSEGSPGEGNSNPLQYSCLRSHGHRSQVGTVHRKESDVTS